MSSTIDLSYSNSATWMCMEEVLIGRNLSVNKKGKLLSLDVQQSMVFSTTTNFAFTKKNQSMKIMFEEYDCE